MKPQRLDLVYEIAWHTAWHVGSGFDSAAADRLVQRHWQRKGDSPPPPFVPGSLVKGVLRHQCERLAVALGVDAIDPHATSEAQQRQLVRHFRPLKDSGLLIDRLFGSRYQGECLFVDNAIPANDTRRMVSLRTRTAMDRVTGTILEGHLFTTELSESTGPMLTGRIRARHPDGVLTTLEDGIPFEYSLLIAGLLSIDALGGDKSSGLGRCQITVRDSEVIWNGQKISLDSALASFEEMGGDWGEWIQELRGEA